MTAQQEHRLGPIVNSFVRQLEGRYKDHCSDTLLTALIMRDLSRTRRVVGSLSGKYPEYKVTYAEDVLGKDPNAAYEAVIGLFEPVLEYGCRCIGNGHHVAQAFQAHVEFEMQAGM